MIVAC